jgi:hypothetical protein
MAARHFLRANIERSCPGSATTGRLLESVRGATEPLLPNKRMTQLRGQWDGRSARRNFFPTLLENCQKKVKPLILKMRGIREILKKQPLKAFQQAYKKGGSFAR